MHTGAKPLHPGSCFEVRSTPFAIYGSHLGPTPASGHEALLGTFYACHPARSRQRSRPACSLIGLDVKNEDNTRGDGGPAWPQYSRLVTSPQYSRLVTSQEREKPQKFEVLRSRQAIPVRDERTIRRMIADAKKMFAGECASRLRKHLDRWRCALFRSALKRKPPCRRPSSLVGGNALGRSPGITSNQDKAL
jgi:hypothetical protein